jgi:hypothetical protein
MPGWLVVGALVAAFGFILVAPLERSYVTFLAVILLVPASLVLPNGITHHLPVSRIAALVLAVRVVIAVRRREISVDVLRPTPVHLAFYIFLGVALVDGVLLASPQTSVSATVDGWLILVEQLIVFVAVLAVGRGLHDAGKLTKPFVVLIGVTTVIAVLERLTGASWGHLVVARVPGDHGILGHPLEQRGGGVRVRAATDFALEYGWLAAMAMPVVVAAAARARHWRLSRTRRYALVALPFLLLVTIYWSNTRSAFAGVALALAIVALFGRNRSATRIVVIAFVLAGLVYVAAPSVRGSFGGTAQTGSTQIREDRLPKIAAAMTSHAYRGLGLTGLSPLGFPTTDAIYLLFYAELGVIGLAALGALLIVLLIYAANGLRGPPSEDRLFAAATFGAIAAGVLAGAAYDTFSLNSTADVFWVLAAIAVMYAERRGLPLPKTRFSWERVAIGTVGLSVGVVLAFAVPTHADVVTPFDAMPISRSVTQGGGIIVGSIYTNTFCDVIHHIPLSGDAQVSCKDSETPGFGELRVDAPTLAAAQRATTKLMEVIPPAAGVEYHASSSDVGRPTWARTAPVWLGLGTLLLALCCPVPSRRRSPVSPRPEPVAGDGKRGGAHDPGDDTRQAHEVARGAAFVAVSQGARRRERTEPPQAATEQR